MFSSLTCAWTGALLISGGLSVAVWSKHSSTLFVFLSANFISLYARTVHASTGLLGYHSRPEILLLGTSWRLGSHCTALHPHRHLHWLLLPLWRHLPRELCQLHQSVLGPIAHHCRPLCAFSVCDVSDLSSYPLIAITNVPSFAYCINIYLKNIWSDEKTATNTSSGLPSYATSHRTQSAKAVWRRVRKVIWLQWRSMLIVVFILVDVVFFSITFIFMDNVVTAVTAKHDISRVEPWLLCLFENGRATDQCFELGQRAIANQGTVIAILFLLAVSFRYALLRCFIPLTPASLPEYKTSSLSPAGRCSRAGWSGSAPSSAETASSSH